jgi:hypothetical protein
MPISQVNNDIERRLLIGLITNKEYCNTIAKILNPNILSASFAQKVAMWAIEHFKKYNTPINEHITQKYNNEFNNLDEDDRTLIEALLLSLSLEKDNDEENDNIFNSKYWIDQTLSYIKKNSLKTISESIANNLKLGRIDEAEKSVIGYNTVAKETTSVRDMTDVDSVVDSVFNRSAYELFSYPGVIGNIMGPIRRSGVHAILSTGKGGKTFLCCELALEAIKAGHHVLYTSHEMNEVEVYERMIQIICKRPYKEWGINGEYAELDCRLNKLNQCRLAQRTNKESYLVGRVGQETVNPDYRPCSACKDGGSTFEPDFFNTVVEKEPMTPQFAKRRLRRWLKFEGGHRLHIMPYAQFSANFDDVKGTLEYLRDTEGIDISIIIDDYINSHKLSGYKDKRLAIIDEWNKAKRLADEANIAIISPLHANAEGMSSMELRPDHISEAKAVFNTITSMVAIDTTPELDAHGVVRLRNLAARFGGGHKKTEFAYLMQCLDHGTFCHDSYFVEHDDKAKIVKARNDLKNGNNKSGRRRG